MFSSRCAVIIAVLLVGCAGCKTIHVNDASIIHPKLARSTPDASVERIRLRAPDGTELEGFFLPHSQARMSVLWYPSSGPAAEDTVTQLKEYGQRLRANVLVMNYRGYGNSGGKPEWNLLFDDAARNLNYLRSRPEAVGKPIVLHGLSLGSLVATNVASHESVAALIAEGSGTNIQDFIDHKIPWYAAPFISIDVDPSLSNMDNMRTIQAVTAPLLLLASKADTDAHWSMAEKLLKAANAAPKRLHVFEHGGHLEMYKQPDYFPTIDAFLDQALATQRGLSSRER